MRKIPVFKTWNSYLNKKLKIIKNYKFINNIKTILAGILFLTSISIYWYFINISSTKWFFIKQENNKLSEIKFQNEIIKIDIEKYKSELSQNTIAKNTNTDISTWKVINITDMMQLTHLP